MKPQLVVFRTIRWKLITSSLLAISIPLVLFTSITAARLWDFYLDQLQEELRTKALIISDTAGRILSPSTPDDPEALKHVSEQWRRYQSMRITVTDARGIIRAATISEDIGKPFSEEDRPGLRLALKGEANSTVWKNPRYGYEDNMYVNLPITENGRVIGAVRVAYTLTQIMQNVNRIRTPLIVAVAIYAFLLVLLTVGLAGTIVRPVEDLKRSAERLAAGDLDHRIPVRGTEEITQLASTLNQMTERLQHLEGMRRQYVSNVSHELRTPLAAIRGMAETMQEHGEADPELRERYLPRIIAQTDRLARLATQLLDLAQIEAGNLVGSFTRVSLATVVDDAFHVCTEKASSGGVRLIADIPPDLPDLYGDRDRLVQVFLNLVDNAIRYTPEGGAVTVTARSEGEWVRAMVADTGQGIPPEHLPHLFERFYRVEVARSMRTGGTGLGLSIVKQIVEAHGGAITVESTVGDGTRFTLELPPAPAGAEESPPPLAHVA